MPDNLVTDRLTLIPLAADAARFITEDRAAAVTALGIEIPDAWPYADLLDFLPMYAQMVQDNPTELGWGIWVMAYRGMLVGDIGFHGRPDAAGRVEIGYSVQFDYRGRGFAPEAALALIEWASAHPDVRQIIARCYPDNASSIRVLQKIGMRPIGGPDDEGLLVWELPQS
jgi:ribosomal-protein-alanine N-acetyltransferase